MSPWTVEFRIEAGGWEVKQGSAHRGIYRSEPEARAAVASLGGIDPVLHPTLTALVAAGTVWEESGALVGLAGDGTVVRVGDTFSPESLAATERFVRNCPREEW